jgi:hypothetical protein
MVAPERPGEVPEELRAVREDAADRRTPSGPPGLAGVCSISGVIAPIRTTFDTRVVPCRPM